MEKKTSKLSEQYVLGIIGGSIPGVISECLEASGNTDRWAVIELDADNVSVSRRRPWSLFFKLLEMIKAIIRIPRVDVVVLVFISPFARFYSNVAHLLGKKVVFYWLGSDVVAAVEDSVDKAIEYNADIHLSYSEGNIRELAAIGVNANLLFMPTRLPDNLSEMPECHSVLLSIPDARRDFYGYKDLMRLVDRFPELEFHVIRSEHPEYYDKRNIVFEGMLDREEMNELFDRVSISVRWPEHDGTSLILMESALKGKYIISRNPFPCGVVTNTFDGLCGALSDILKNPPTPCMENREYALKHFTQQRAGKEFVRYLDSLVD